jgi:hypothetical protein
VSDGLRSLHVTLEQHVSDGLRSLSVTLEKKDGDLKVSLPMDRKRKLNIHLQHFKSCQRTECYVWDPHEGVHLPN